MKKFSDIIYEQKEDKIALPKVTHGAYEVIRKLDEKLIGTDNYIGLAYFWDMEYKHQLRDASDTNRQKVHQAFLDNHLKVDGKSDKHQEIVDKICGK